MKAPVTLHTPTSDELAYLAELQYRAFSPGRIHPVLFGKAKLEDLVATGFKELQEALDDEASGGVMKVLCAKRGEQILGYAQWELPTPSDPERGKKKEDKKHDWPEGTDHKLAAELLGKGDKWSEKPFYLDPSVQRSGAGRALLQWAIERAAKSGHDIYLKASPEGVPFYKSLGFKACQPTITAGANNELELFPMVLRPPITLVPAVPADARPITEMHWDTFLPGELFQTLFSKASVPQKLAIEEKHFLAAIENNNGSECVMKAMRAGEMVGYAWWHLPREEGQEEGEKEGDREFPEGSNMPAARDFFQDIDKRNEKLKTKPHYGLSILGVAPQHQGTGVGVKLIRWGTDRADKEGLDVHLEASKEGIEVYKSLGFVQDADVFLPSDGSNGFVVTPMVRHPVPPPPAPTLILPVTENDIPALVEIDRAAFTPGEFYTSLYSAVDPEDFKTLRRGVFEKSLHSENLYFVKAVRGDVVVGYAMWVKPRKEGEAVVASRSTLPKGAKEDVAREFYQQLDAWEEEYQRPFLQLRLIATEPRLGRQGIASALLKWGIAKASEESVPIRLISTEAGRPFYEKHGFVKEGEPLVASDKSFQSYPYILHPPRHPVTIRPATTDDVQTLSELFVASFGPHKKFHALFADADIDDYIRLSNIRWQNVIKDPGQALLVAERDGKIVSFAYYVLPKTLEQMEKAAKEDKPSERPFPRGANNERLKSFIEVVERWEKEIRPPHYNLVVLGTDPKQQRTGAGRALLQWGIERAEAEQVDILLEATDAGLPMYLNFGFVRNGDPIMPSDESFKCYPMIRRPTPRTDLVNGNSM